MTAKKQRPVWRIAGIAGGALAVLLALGVIAFVLWANHAAQPMPQALAALASDAAVTVSTEPWLVFMPEGGAPEQGFIFYPGARVDARAYAPAARALAQAGYLAVITPMPLNLAVFAPNRADRVITAYPAIRTWAIGGHSLGGVMAAGYAGNNPDVIETIVFWAAYPAAGNSLRDAPLNAASIYGTLDGLATVAEVEASRPLLPDDAVFVAIEGGNHAQFGWYGEQSGDNPAAISREEQQRQIIEATLAALKE
ncbi:MAG: alpha/beta hydrolase [Caldilineaceae bacterium]|nr:alpha/beta hydrolase [Caldilineaceae bacterium]